MTVVSLPPMFIEPVGPVDGAEILAWELDEAPERQDEIELVVVPQFARPWTKRFAELPALRAVQLASAGYEYAVPLLPPGVALANAVGVHDTATAEMALTLLLAAQRDIPTFVRQQDQGSWLRYDEGFRGLADTRVLIVGYGGIGRALAARLAPCEASVTAVASRAREGDEHVDRVHGIDELDELLPEAHAVVLALPDLPTTKGTLDARTLALLPDDALVVNVGRGPAIETDALLAECASGRLRAALDVTDPEPLPDGHPLFSTPGVLISPHTGGASRAFVPRASVFLRRQIEAFLREGELPHTVAVGEG